MNSLNLLDKNRRLDIILYGVLLSLALLMGMYRVDESGPLWPDGPRYANGAAMIRDWLLSDRLLEPFAFARENYCQYPGFSIPYHPPVYPALMGLTFAVVGVSYVTARFFIAICLGLSSLYFFGIMRKLQAGRAQAFIGSILFLLTPEIARWARDTMSEIPALMFILGGSYFLLKGLGSGRPGWCWAAFGMAQLSFLSRMTSAGVLPGWYLASLWMGKMRGSIRKHMILAGTVYLGISIVWVWFAIGYSKYEMVENHARTRVSFLSWDNISFYPSHLPSMAGWGVMIASVAAAVFFLCFLKRQKYKSLPMFWTSWFISFYVFQLVQSTNEQRYFIFALPSLIGLATFWFGNHSPKIVKRAMAPLFLVLLVLSSAVEIASIPQGIVGFDRVARTLNGFKQPGNVLLACYQDSEFMFRYRATSPLVQRTLVRADRTLAIRLSDWAAIQPRILVRNMDDFINILVRGRIRYLLTCTPALLLNEDRTEEMVLAHNWAKCNPDKFRMIETFPLILHKPENCRQLFLWEYLGQLPAGKSELPVIIPTAELELSSSD